MKNVLIAAYYFPPYALVSAVRITKFCKYLPQFGWKPWILTVDPDFYQGRILSEVPSEVNKMKIHRIPFYRFPGAVAIGKLLFPLILIFFALRHKRHIDVIKQEDNSFSLDIENYAKKLNPRFRAHLKLPKNIQTKHQKQFE